MDVGAILHLCNQAGDAWFNLGVKIFRIYLINIRPQSQASIPKTRSDHSDVPVVCIALDTLLNCLTTIGYLNIAADKWLARIVSVEAYLWKGTLVATDMQEMYV
jgi:hypothetical protein